MYSNINRRQYLKDLATVAVGFSIAGPLMSMQQPQKGKTIQVITKTKRTREEIDIALKEIKPVSYQPESNRWQNLPITCKALQKTAGELKIVMLGDSILNDTFRSNWFSFVQKAYPDCKISAVAVVANGGGCWWFKEEGRINQSVVPEAPDLLIIGGISQKDDMESIKEVIKQVRSVKNCDVLLMTKSFGLTEKGNPHGGNPFDPEQWSYDIPQKSTDYRKRLFDLSLETKSGFLDMTAHWGRYIRQSEQPVEWYKRDPIHANERGEQVIGQILASHFLPVK